MFHRAQSPQASAGPSHGCPSAQRQLQVPPPEQSASTAQVSGPDASVPEVVALVSVDLDVSAPLDAGVHASNVEARENATSDTILCMGPNLSGGTRNCRSAPRGPRSRRHHLGSHRRSHPAYSRFGRFHPPRPGRTLTVDSSCGSGRNRQARADRCSSTRGRGCTCNAQRRRSRIRGPRRRRRGSTCLLTSSSRRSCSRHKRRAQAR